MAPNFAGDERPQIRIVQQRKLTLPTGIEYCLEIFIFPNHSQGSVNTFRGWKVFRFLAVARPTQTKQQQIRLLIQVKPEVSGASIQQLPSELLREQLKVTTNLSRETLGFFIPCVSIQIQNLTDTRRISRCCEWQILFYDPITNLKLTTCEQAFFSSGPRGTGEEFVVNSSPVPQGTKGKGHAA